MSRLMVKKSELRKYLSTLRSQATIHDTIFLGVILSEQAEDARSTIFELTPDGWKKTVWDELYQYNHTDKKRFRVGTYIAVSKVPYKKEKTLYENDNMLVNYIFKNWIKDSDFYALYVMKNDKIVFSLTWKDVDPFYIKYAPYLRGKYASIAEACNPDNWAKILKKAKKHYQVHEIPEKGQFYEKLRKRIRGLEKWCLHPDNYERYMLSLPGFQEMFKKWELERQKNPELLDYSETEATKKRKRSRTPAQIKQVEGIKKRLLKRKKP